jgi:type I restriction enzyme, R subunit
VILKTLDFSLISEFSVGTTDFIQVKGRGTRLFDFKHGEGTSLRTAKKSTFALFDFFGNYEYFEEDFDYDQKLSLPKGPPEETGEDGGDGGIRIEDFTNTSPDPMSSVIRDEIGLFGMRIDREMYRERFAQQASEAVATDAALLEAFDAEDWPAVEERVRRLLFEKPEEYWNLAKLQEVYKTDRLPSLREILARVFGLIADARAAR